MRPQIFGHARRVPVLGAAGFDGDFDDHDVYCEDHHGYCGDMKAVEVLTLVLLVATSLLVMMATVIGDVVILNAAARKMVWVELKFPYLLLMASKMPMFTMSGRPRLIRYLICMITLPKRRQSLLQLSLKVML
jgi:hypothetical protein